MRLITKSVLVYMFVFFFFAEEFLHFFLISSVISILKFLKEFCQEDFAVSVNPVLTSLVRSTLPCTPNACVESSRRYRKKFYHGSLSNFFGDYCRHYIQTLKSWLNFFNFFNFHMAFATDDRNRFQCLNIYSFT